MSAHCADDIKYEIVARVTDHFRAAHVAGSEIADQIVKTLITINGVRFGLADGSWGLVRASSNKPELVVVCESPVSREQMMAVVTATRSHLKTYPEVGELQQVPGK